ncbi:hypothetical protein AMTRI_Chr01g128620 [Amborella trichopoda]
MAALNPSTYTGYLARIETLNGSNFSDWKQKIEITLGILDLDLALREDKPPKPNNESTISFMIKVHQQFVGPTKAVANTVMTKLLIMSYDGHSFIGTILRK